MSIVYVDLEHESARRARAPSHAVKLEKARKRLARAAGQPCQVVHFPEVSPQQLAQLAPSAVVLSGSTTDWAEYDRGSLDGLIEVIRSAPAPILGICAGQQLIGHAHGARSEPMGQLQEGEVDPDPRFAAGMRKERGFVPLEINEPGAGPAGPTCPLFRGLEVGAGCDRPCFFQSHYWELREVPAGFVARGRSASSPIQVIERLDKPVFGVQFHPERFDADHPDGDTLLRNFFTLANH